MPGAVLGLGIGVVRLKSQLLRCRKKVDLIKYAKN